MQSITSDILFGVVLSLAAFEIGILINRKTRLAVLNPLLLAILFVIGFLLLFKIDFDTYDKGGQFINMFLGPSTVVLAVPLYKQLDLLKKNAKAILIGVFCGTCIGILSIIVVSCAIGLNLDIIKSLIPKSVTTPIAIAVSSQLGGNTPITVLAVIVTGIIGAVLAPTICKIFRIKDRVAIGIAMGSSSHAVGTSKALELGDVEGAMSSLAIGIAGIMTVVIAPIACKFAIYLYGIIH